MSTIAHVVWLAYAAPLVGCVLIGLVGLADQGAVLRRVAPLVGCLSTGVSAVLAIVAWVLLDGRSPDSRAVHDVLWTWLSAGSFHADQGILYDPLSAVMVLVVAGVGFLIHVYSVGYMHGDTEEPRYFAYLNLFVFSMLILVLASNFVVLLVGWGMVGLSSYLLIGFWHTRPSAVAAAKKAFVMNAVGDVGMALGIFLIFRELGTVDYLEVFAQRAQLGVGTSTINWVCFLLLVGAVAKSAQLPLHTWLPDAMEGPTPVSALIHAATMVTAGVYLIARMNPLYSYAPDIQHLIVAIGVAGLLMAGFIALSQTDIKRVIAYSTMSQIAYMFVGVGLGAYWAGIYHLVTHAFFKALLFMAAGVVIHALSGEQDIRRMGGMRRFLPRTYACTLIGVLTLVGVFPLSGSLSKDPIIASGIDLGGFWGYLAFFGGSVGALLTGLYGFRLLFLVFHGEPSPFAAEHAPHHTEHGEGPLTMLVPVYVLTALAALAGILQVPDVTHYMSSFLDPTVYGAPAMLEPTDTEDWLTTAIVLAAGLGGAAIAYRLYGAGRTEPVEVPAGLRTLSERKLYFDELYDLVFYRPAARFSAALRDLVERPVFLLPIDAVGPLFRRLARGVSALQTGAVRVYALLFAVGVATLVVYFMAQA
jgi:NADH-quinone oxidoreductase subunit L